MYKTFKSSKALKNCEASKIGFSKMIDVLVRASCVACDVVTKKQADKTKGTALKAFKRGFFGCA